MLYWNLKVLRQHNYTENVSVSLLEEYESPAHGDELQHHLKYVLIGGQPRSAFFPHFDRKLIYPPEFVKVSTTVSILHFFIK